MVPPRQATHVVEDPHLLPVEDVVAALGSDAQDGLTQAEAAARLEVDGPNVIVGEKGPSLLQAVGAQLRDPMNLMMVAVAVVSLLIGQVPTGVFVALLVGLNTVFGAQRELKAQASVDALSTMQVPQCRVVRDGQVRLVPAPDVVPGDLVLLEAGDLVPADGRIVRSATCETAEAALTGESAPVAKDAEVLPGPQVALGDQANMAFQSTSVTRGTAAVVVTATGMGTQMGQIAAMLTGVRRTRSPLQKELDGLTRVIGLLAWGAVAIIVAVGLARGLSMSQVLLLGTAMAVSAIPSGMPTFVQVMLSYGARRLADAKAIVKNLSDVETLGATSAINSDKTGTLTLNEMMVSRLYADGSWYRVDGHGYGTTGAVRGAAGVELPDLTRLAYALALCSDATVDDLGEVVGDPTEAALVVLAAKVGVDAQETRRAYPRVAEVPFDSEYKFMATFHRVPVDGRDRLVALVKGGPDVVLGRCTGAGAVHLDGSVAPLDRAAADDANAQMGASGLRVLAFAIRVLDDADEPAVVADPMAFAQDLAFVGMVGIIDPLRPEAKRAVAVAHAAGIEVRMITGDHAVTASAIGAELGLGPGAMSGAELAALSDDELVARLDQVHVFGRVTPADKLRLARVMQSTGRIVAMTGDAVNDAAALKQADIGVAMGSGSQVTKQAARMILTDDNFGTLVHAIELGRTIHGTISAYVRYQMSQLLALVMLFVAASVLDVNHGVALPPLLVLFLSFFLTIAPISAIALDPGDPDVMRRPPRDPKVTIANRHSVLRWTLYGFVGFVAAFLPMVLGPDEPSTEHGTVSMTMSYVTLGFTTLLAGLVMRRDPGSGLTAPALPALRITAASLVLLVLSTELGGMQAALLTTSLTATQWTVCLALALLTPLVVETDKALRRRREVRPALTVLEAVAPEHG